MNIHFAGGRVFGPFSNQPTDAQLATARNRASSENLAEQFFIEDAPHTGQGDFFITTGAMERLRQHAEQLESEDTTTQTRTADAQEIYEFLKQQAESNGP